MSCSKCPGKAVYENKNTGNLCSSCFLDMIEKRIRKELKNSGWLNKNEKVLILDDNSLEANVTEDLFKKAIGSLPLQIEKSTDLNENYNHVILPWSLERETNGFLSGLFTGNNKNVEEKQMPKCIKLLKSISEEEIELIAKIKNISGKLKGTEKNYVSQLEKKYPGSKLALVKAVKEFEE